MESESPPDCVDCTWLLPDRHGALEAVLFPLPRDRYRHLRFRFLSKGDARLRWPQPFLALGELLDALELRGIPVPHDRTRFRSGWAAADVLLRRADTHEERVAACLNVLDRSAYVLWADWIEADWFHDGRWAQQEYACCNWELLLVRGRGGPDTRAVCVADWPLYEFLRALGAFAFEDLGHRKPVDMLLAPYLHPAPKTSDQAHACFEEEWPFRLRESQIRPFVNLAGVADLCEAYTSSARAAQLRATDEELWRVHADLCTVVGRAQQAAQELKLVGFMRGC